MLEVNLNKSIGGFNLNIRFEHRKGVLILFGRSGAGKTLTLRCISGIASPTSGLIRLNGDTLYSSESRTDVGIRRRDIGYIFQHDTLFPHMTAGQNIAYAAKGGDVQRWLDVFHVAHLVDRYPRQLSGGEQQRVAIIRALVTKPKLLLMDEPLSAVDIARRNVLLDELRDLQRSSGIPIVYVTHNVSEAYRLGDRVLVLEKGRVIHDGVPLEVFPTPTSIPLASLYGTENILTGIVEQHHPDDGTTELRVGRLVLHVPLCADGIGESAMVAIRPEDILVARRRITGTSARNQLAGRIRSVTQDTAPSILVELGEGVTLRARVTPRSLQALELKEGSEVYLLIKAWACHPIERER